ncbi:MAG TPA: TIM barrel protein [Candidatus Acidoferrum sp.]|nr:TIM barrel protein [Candidatus Acidoferrum sp.]
MAISRRELLGVVAAGTALAQDQPPGPNVPRPRTPPKPRSTPEVCLFSQHLLKIEYQQLGLILKDLGFDGCNLAIIPGAHVPPEKAGSDLMREIEAVAGVGLDVPIMTTSANSANDMNGRQVLAIAGFMQVPLIRSGVWRYGAGDPEARVIEVQREVLSFASLCRAYNIGLCLPNLTGDAVGAALWDYSTMLRGVDPRFVGYDFDPGCATQAGGPEGAVNELRVALPRLKAVTVSDALWTKDGMQWKVTPCPLGEGSVDWTKFFGTLAKAKFVGPLTLEMRYQPANELNAMRKDLEFIRKQIAAAYGSAG